MGRTGWYVRRCTFFEKCFSHQIWMLEFDLLYFTKWFMMIWIQMLRELVLISLRRISCSGVHQELGMFWHANALCTIVLVKHTCILTMNTPLWYILLPGLALRQNHPGHSREHWQPAGPMDLHSPSQRSWSLRPSAVVFLGACRLWVTSHYLIISKP